MTTRSGKYRQRFVVRSDTQYNRTEHDGQNALEILGEQDDAINTWRGQYSGRIPVFINGDVTEFGHAWQWKVMLPHLRQVPDTFWGLGNHDYENNVGGCVGNGCAKDSVLHLIEAANG